MNLTKEEVFNGIDAMSGKVFKTAQLAALLEKEFQKEVPVKDLSGRLSGYAKSNQLERVRRGFWRVPQALPQVQKQVIAIDENTEITYEVIGKSIHRYIGELSREVFRLKEELRKALEENRESTCQIGELTENLRKVNEKLTTRNQNNYSQTVKLGEVARLFKKE